MNKEEFLSKYWDYYLMLEQKVMALKNYIEFEEENFECYSNEITSLILNICSELDIVFKLVTNSSKSSIEDYKTIILNDDFYSNMLNEQITLLTCRDILILPFSSICNNESPSWWKDYNSIKHNRVNNSNYKKSNMKNLLNSLGGLYILEIYYFNKNYSNSTSESIPLIKSKLFESKLLKSNFLNSNELNFYEIGEISDDEIE